VEQQFQPTLPQPQGTQAVDRAAQLLVLLLGSEQPLALTDLAAASGLPKSTASRVIGALERHGLVQQDGERGRLTPGPAVLRFAHRGLWDRHMIELAGEPMQALAEASGETINLGVPTVAGVEHLAQVDSAHFLGTTQWLGRRVDYHSTAEGKVFLAFGAASLPAGRLAAAAPSTIVDRDRLRGELVDVRRRGVATAVDELEPGLAALAAPVRGSGGDVLAALSISGPTLRLPSERLIELSPALIEHAEALSRRLGHHEAGDHAA
jgi:IclR family acetate operon transcriptional repressor